jgi:hypothetical protein
MAVQGPSGSGKTEGALALATNLLKAMGFTTPEQLDGKIMLVDTENDSASLYADRYVFDTIGLRAPYTPERYKRAMQRAIDGKYTFLLVDSITHEWDGEGGILRTKDKLDLVPGSNSFTNWAKMSPEHEGFIEFIKGIPIHTITTMRTKQAYVLETNAKGKLTPRKLGMAPVQREGAEYEYSIVFDVDMAHGARTSKNRTRLFEEDGEDGRRLPVAIDLADPGVANAIYGWLQSGAVLAEKEWKAPVDAPAPAGGVAAAPVERAVPPKFMSVGDRQKFWIDVKKSGKNEEDLRIWLFETFGIASTSQLPGAATAIAKQWATSPKAVRTLEPGERKARDAAAILGVCEKDLRMELDSLNGNWEQLYDLFGKQADEAVAKEEAAKVAHEKAVAEREGAAH